MIKVDLDLRVSVGGKPPTEISLCRGGPLPSQFSNRFRSDVRYNDERISRFSKVRSNILDIVNIFDDVVEPAAIAFNSCETVP
jgi:hypothetical protein